MNTKLVLLGALCICLALIGIAAAETGPYVDHVPFWYGSPPVLITEPGEYDSAGASTTIPENVAVIALPGGMSDHEHGDDSGVEAEIEMVNGWNTFSTPLALKYEKNDVASVFTSGEFGEPTVATVITYTGSAWVGATTFAPGDGYYVYMNAPDQTPRHAKIQAAKSQPDDIVKTFAAGFQLFGYIPWYADETMVERTNINGIKWDGDLAFISIASTYNPGGYTPSGWGFVYGDTPPLNKFEIGRAYWIHVTDDGSVTVPYLPSTPT